MTFFHALQIALWLAALLGIARQLRRQFSLDPVSSTAITKRFEDADEPGRVTAARQLSERLGGSWLAKVAVAELRECDGEFVNLALRRGMMRPLSTIMTIGRMAPPLAFLGVVLELTAAFGGGEGLEALQRGLPEQLALGRAATGVAIGVMTSWMCFAVARPMAAMVRTVERDAHRLCGVIAERSA